MQRHGPCINFALVSQNVSGAELSGRHGWGVVTAYESQNPVGPERRSVQLEDGVTDGPYRLRGASDTVWAAQGYSRRNTFGQRFADAVVAIGRLVVPVTFLSMSFLALYLYADRELPYFADSRGQWLTVSHVLLPLAFLTVHLTNRRYGPSYAFAQIVVSLALCGAVFMFAGDQVGRLAPTAVVLSARELLSVVGAFVVAGFLSIVAFDGARGPRWWMAPLIGSIVASLSFVLIFYPAAFGGSDGVWVNHMAAHAGILAGASVVGLVPFWLLRAAIPPLPGFGGY